ncbi:MAG: TVP38/TMEM64 family protein [Xanthomonadales bacterium]|nr:VTT domain-containing protein [Gammaproteobacteria bacterium]NNE04728.1 TVP38/TMEM64 family protein [Xanthomonadales bacterium]NNL94589.1 TVP38/TMEM64 family protein [Xanthomonadales bacterium]
MPGLEYIISAVEWMQANPQLSGLVFLLLFATVIAVGLPGTAILWLSSGMIFGTIPGAVLSVLGATLAAAVTNLLIRTAFGRWLDERAGEARDRVRHFLHSGNTFLLIVPRLVPFFPLFVVNVVFSAAGVPRKAYLLSTMVGLIPLATIFANIGSQFSDVSQLSGVRASSLVMAPKFLVPLALLLVITLVGWWIYHRLEVQQQVD